MDDKDLSTKPKPSIIKKKLKKNPNWKVEKKLRTTNPSHSVGVYFETENFYCLLGYRYTTYEDLIIQKEKSLTIRFIFLAGVLGYS